MKDQLSDKLKALIRKITCLKGQNISLQTAERLLRLQRDISSLLSKNWDINQIVEVFLDAVLTIPDICCAGVYLVDENKKTLNLAHQIGIHPALSSEISSLGTNHFLSSSFLSGEPIQAQASRAHHPLGQIMQSHGIRQLTLTPVKPNDQITAVLLAGSHSHTASGDIHQTIFKVIAAQIGAAILQRETDTSHKKELKNFLENLEDCLFILDNNGSILYGNPTAVKRLGYSLAEISKMHVLDIHPPNRREETAKLFSDLLQENTSTCNIPLLTKSGELIEVDTKISRGQWENQQVFFGICRDVSAHKQAEKTLRRSRARYRAILEDQTDLICRFLPGGTLTFVNSAYCRFFNKKPEELLGRSFLSLIPEEDRKKIEGYLQALNLGNPVTEVEHKVLHPDGRIVWQRWINRAIFDQKNTVIEFQSVGRDITERKRAELALQESEARYRLLAESVSDVIWVLGLDMRIQYVSPATNQMTGYSVEETLYLKPQEVLTYPSWMKFLQIFLELTRSTSDPLQASPRKNIELKLTRKDGTSFWTESIITTLRDPEGQITGLIGVTRDISERKLHEKRMQSIHDELERRVRERTAVLSEVNEQLNKQMEHRIWTARALRQSEETALALLNATSEAAFLLDGNFQVLAANNTAVQRLGIAINDQMQECLPQILPPTQASARLSVFKRVIAEGKPTSFKEKYKDRLFHTKVFPVIDSQKGMTRIAVFSQDITEREKTLEKIKEGEARQKAILNNIPDMAWLKDNNFRYIAVNEAFVQICGKKTAELVGKTDLDIWPKDQAEIYRAEDLRVMRSGKTLRIEAPMFQAKDNLGMFETIKTPIYNSQGVIVGTAGIARDITERKKAEEALKQEKEKFKILVEHYPVGISLIQKDGAYEYVNPAFVEIFGYDLTDFNTGREWLRLVFPNQVYRRKAVALWKGHQQDASQAKYAHFSVSCKDKSEKEIEFRAVNLPNGDYVFLYDDITARIKAEEALKESEAGMRRLFEASPDPIVVFDMKRAVIYCNPIFTEIFGWSLGEVQGKRIPMFVPGQDKQELEQLIKRMHRGQPVRNVESRRLTKDGRTLDMQISGSLFRDSKGRPAGVIIILRDISKRRLVEKKLMDYQVQLRKLTSELTMTEERERRRLAVHLHDGLAQNLALMSIKLESELGSAKRPRKKPLQEILHMIDQALQEARSITVELSPPILHELGLEAALNWLAEQTQQNHGIVTAVSVKMPPQQLETDLAVWLFRAARELLLNCAKHSRAAQVNISLESDDTDIELCVQDNGKGFDSHNLEPLFNKGFGLFSLRERVRSWGGELIIYSKPGQGTQVTVKTKVKLENGN